MSYAIGSKANTRGRKATLLPCVLCGVAVRVYRLHADGRALSQDRGVTCCAPCHNGRETSAQVTALIAQLEPAVSAALKVRRDTDRAVLLSEPFVPGRVTAMESSYHRYRLELWAAAVDASLRERGVTNQYAPMAAAV